ncbi:MAG: pentapeptide repeat-containing protein [Alphaproteobacteria bacterium]
MESKRPPPLPDSEQLVEKDHEGTAGKLEMMETALNAQSARASLVWITVMTGGYYLLSSISAIKDQHRLFLEMIKLPIVGIDIDLQNFLVGSPIAFSALHIYALYKAVLVAGTAGNYDKLVNKRPRPDWALHAYWHRLDLFFIARLFGPGRAGDRWVIVLVALAFACGLIVAPLCVLSVFFYTSLPMRVPLITGSQVLALVLSTLFTILAMWILRQQAKSAGRRILGRWLKRVAFTVILVIMSVLMLLPLVRARDGLRVAGIAVEAAAGRKIDLRSRDLRYADLTDAQLNGLNLDAANLSGAVLTGANLTGARMRGAILNDATLSRATLIETDLTDAKLRGAWLDDIVGDGLLLNAADLSGANLKRATLQGARMTFATLENVILDSAHLNMALLDYADLSVDTLDSTIFTAVSCRYCALRVRTMTRANMKVLEEADLYGSSLLIGADDRAPRCLLASDLPPPQAAGGWRATANQFSPQVFSELGLNNIENLRQRIQKRWDILKTLKHCEEAIPPFVPQGRPQLGRRVVEEACRLDAHAPYVARAALLRIRRHSVLFGPPSFDEGDVVRKLLDMNECPGANALTFKERDALIRKGLERFH